MESLAELKNEYLAVLSDLLAVPIYQGIASIYDAAAKVAEMKESGEELRVFQDLLKDVVPRWPAPVLAKEVERVRTVTKQGEILDDLLRAVLKSSIMLQTQVKVFSDMTHVSRDSYEEASFSTFLHKCYVLTAREFFNNPYLFARDTPENMKKNQRDAVQIIHNTIRHAIRQSLPLKGMLREFLEEPIDKQKAFNNTVSLLAEDGNNQIDKVFSTYNIRESQPDANEECSVPAPQVSNLSNHSITNLIMDDPKLVMTESLVQSPIEE